MPSATVKDLGNSNHSSSPAAQFEPEGQTLASRLHRLAALAVLIRLL